MATDTDVGAGDDGSVDVDGVAGIGNEDHVALIERGEAEVGDAFFGADGDDGFRVGVEGDVVALRVPVADGAAQAGNAFGEGVAVRLRAARGLDHFFDDVGGRGAIGIAHAEVDDVFAAHGGRRL